jgi:RNA polymerase sigma-70 factor (ECF subfamily)
MVEESVSRSHDAGVTVERDLARFYEDHYARLLRLAGLIAHVGIQPEDVVQAAMEQAWRRRATFGDSGRLRSWLDRIVVREAIRGNRSAMRNVQGLTTVPPFDLPDLQASGGSLRLTIIQAFRSLPIEQRAVVVLHLHLGYSLAETASITKSPLETVRSRLRLARQRLRRELQETSS